MSELNQTFKIQVHLIIEDIVIEDLDGEITGNDILDSAVQGPAWGRKPSQAEPI